MMAYGSTRGLGAYGPEIDKHMKSSEALDFDSLNLNPEFLKGISDMGFVVLNDLQRVLLPSLLSAKEGCVVVQCGRQSGKSTTAMIASVNKVNTKKMYPQVLFLSPSSVSSRQIEEAIKQLTKFAKINVSLAISGGQVIRDKISRSHIIVGTPEAVHYWLVRLQAFDPRSISFLALDEANVLLQSQQSWECTNRIYMGLPSSCQMLALSSILSDQVLKFADSIEPAPVIHKVSDYQVIIHEDCVMIAR